MSIAARFIEGTAQGMTAQQEREERERRANMPIPDAYGPYDDGYQNYDGYGGRSLEVGRSNAGQGGVSGMGRPQGGASTGGSFYDLLDKHEGGGGWDTLFGHSQNGGRFDGVRVSQMTLDEVSDFADPSGEYGQWVKQQLAASGQRARVATPMGRGQIVGTTLRNTAKAMGLPGDTKFDEGTQKAMIRHLAMNRIRGQSTMSGKLAAMRAEWEGFKHVSDADLSRAIRELEGGGGHPAESTAAPAPVDTGTDTASEDAAAPTPPRAIISDDNKFQWMKDYMKGNQQ